MIERYLNALGEKTKPWNSLRKTGLLFEIIKNSWTIDSAAARYDLNPLEIKSWCDAAFHSIEKTLQIKPPREHSYVDMVFDVGANSGQYAKKIRKEGYDKTIISFEPIAAAHSALQLNSKDDPRWIIHPRCALADFKGEAWINVAENSYSSSLLNILEAHTRAAPDSKYISRERIKIEPLDSIYNKYYKHDMRVMLKIDTQGFEDKVLIGGKRSLDSIGIVRLELSTVPLYEGQRLYDYFFHFFEKKGFGLWDVQPAFQDRRSGRLLQFDAVFVRDGFLE